MNTASAFLGAKDRTRCERCAKHYTLASLIVNLLMALLKVEIALVSGSRALMAAALYSMNDVITAVVVLFSLRYGRAPPDEKHAYGHHKVDFLAAATVGILLMLAVTGILYYSVLDLLHGTDGPPHLIAGAVAALTLGVNELLARKGLCVANHTGSLAVRTSAEHNRADSISSAAVIVGVIGASLGLHFMDPAVAVFETVHIVWLSGALFGRSLRGLMDASISEAEVRGLTAACCEVEGVQRMEQLRTRRVGSVTWVEAVVGVVPDQKVARAYEISQQVEAAIRRVLAGEVQAHVRFKTAEFGAPCPCPTAVVGDLGHG